jgi:hypothetical protein
MSSQQRMKARNISRSAQIATDGNGMVKQEMEAKEDIKESTQELKQDPVLVSQSADAPISMDSTSTRFTPNRAAQDIHNECSNLGAQGVFHGDVHIHYSAQQPPLPVPFLIPALPDDFVPRPREFEQLLAHLCNTSHTPIAITTALAGESGFGKTTLAKSCCHDARVHAAFPSGMLWVEVGQEPDTLVGKIEELILHLSGSQRRKILTDLNAATSQLAQVIGERRLLLVIDDVWDSTHLQLFLQGAPYCTRLVTTHLPHILPTTARVVSVNAMEQEEALALLSFGLPDTDAHTGTLRKLARLLGERALLIKLVNRALREQVSVGSRLSDALDFVTERLAAEGINAFC